MNESDDIIKVYRWLEKQKDKLYFDGIKKPIDEMSEEEKVQLSQFENLSILINDYYNKFIAPKLEEQYMTEKDIKESVLIMSEETWDREDVRDVSHSYIALIDDEDSLEQLLEVVKNKLKTEGEVVRRCSNRYCDKAITKRLDGKLKLVRDAYGTGKDNEEKLLFCEECYKERKVE